MEECVPKLHYHEYYSASYLDTCKVLPNFGRCLHGIDCNRVSKRPFSVLTMATPSIYVQISLREMRRSLHQSRLLRSSAPLPKGKCQSWKAHGASSQRAGFSTGDATRQEPIGPGSSILSVAPKPFELNSLLIRS